MKLDLTDREIEIITEGLSFKKNMIETGNPLLSANDVQAGHKGKINALNHDQMKLVIGITELIQKLMGSRIT